MGNVIDIQCPSCNAPLHFNSKVGKMKCEYCENEFTVEDLKHVEEVDYTEQADDGKVKYVNYLCSDCGAEIIADEQTSATFCLYCGNTAILKNKLSGKFAPNSIIPFKVDKNDAIEAFKGLKKGRPFIPSDFISEKNIEKITGLYVPFWLYEINVDGTLQIEGINVTHWTSGDRYYTKKDYYDAVRAGSMKFHKVPVDGSTRFDNDMMNSIEPFNYEELKKYNHAYLSGYLAEKYDVSLEECEEEALSRSVNSARDEMLHDMGPYSTTVTKTDTLTGVKTDSSYVLLPVWMVNVKYKDKYYLFAMNGQTGKFIGDIPIDKKKVFTHTVLYFFVAFVICMLVAYLFHLGGMI